MPTQTWDWSLKLPIRTVQVVPHHEIIPHNPSHPAKLDVSLVTDLLTSSLVVNHCALWEKSYLSLPLRFRQLPSTFPSETRSPGSSSRRWRHSWHGSIRSPTCRSRHAWTSPGRRKGTSTQSPRHLPSYSQSLGVPPPDIKTEIVSWWK